MTYRKILITLHIALFLTLANIAPSYAECTEKTCIDVYVEDGKIVIDAKRNGASASAKPRVVVSSPPKTAKPRITKPRTIKPSNTKPSLRIRPSNKPSYKPRTISPKPKRSAISLADKVLQSLPTLQVAYQPEGRVLTRVPVIFFTDLPTQFNKDFKILGEMVRINVKPRSLWNFGDGSVLITSKPGRPYPATDITHSYSAPGLYEVSVSTIWSGSFTVGEVTKDIPGAIRQVSAIEVKVVGASTKFVGK